MPKIDLTAIPQTNRTSYPAPYNVEVAGRWQRPVADAVGITDFGVRHVTLEPGGWSSHRHWHEGEDEFVVILAGEATLIEEGSRTLLGPGDCAAFLKDLPNGHHLVNESDAPCAFVAVGCNFDGDCHYPDIDMHVDGPSGRYVHKDRTPY